MITTCHKCGKRYDDAERWTYCPHEIIGAESSVYCSQCDLFKPCLCPAHNEQAHGKDD